MRYVPMTIRCESGMRVVSILARKGGTGKSTAARCLAVEALKSGRRVVIIDLDPQATGHKWSQRRAANGIPVPLTVTPTAGGVAAQLESFRAQGVDLVLIDTPPVATPTVNAALDASDAAIVVTRPNPEDLESIQESLRVARAQGRPTATILWQCPPDKRVRSVSMAQAALENVDANLCPTTISASVSYPYSYAELLTPQEREPEGRARAELADVWAWLQKENIVVAPYGNTAGSPTDHSVRRPRGKKAAA